MSKFLRFFGIFGIAFACMFGTHSSALALVLDCNGNGSTTTIANPTTSECNCDDAMNGMTDGSVWSVSRCQCYTLPTASQASCSAPTGYELIGWQLVDSTNYGGDTLWMFKPGWKIVLGSSTNVGDAEGNTVNKYVSKNSHLRAIWTKVNKTFEITTTELSKGTKFEIKIAAKGDYRIDWGDGTVDNKSKSSNSVSVYSHTYKDKGVYHIGLSGLARNKTTEVYSVDRPVIEFVNKSQIAGISGSLGAIFNSSWGMRSIHSGQNLLNAPSYQELFKGASNLTGNIPPELFVGSPTVPLAINGGFFPYAYLFLSGELWSSYSGDSRLPKFKGVFYGCSGLTGSIPEKLFGDVARDVDHDSDASSFEETFSGCSGLTGSIPEHLFCDELSSSFGPRTFRHTFNGCHGLSGSIPENLFRCVQWPAENLFDGTFKYAWSLIGNIPAGLFRNLSGNMPAYMFRETFEGCSNLTGFVDPDLFGTKSGRWNNSNSTGMMQNIFKNASHMDTSCPSGYTEFETGFRQEWWNNGTGAKVISCTQGGTPNYPVYTVTLDRNGGTSGVTSIYEKYLTGWAKTNTSSTWADTLSGLAPSRSGGDYLFLGYYTGGEFGGLTITPENWKFNNVWSGEVTPKIARNGNLNNVSPDVDGAQTWAAWWIRKCENLFTTHGSCTTTVETTGTGNVRFKYNRVCDSGYTLSDDMQTCEEVATILQFQLNKHDGTGGANGPLYESVGNGWSLSNSGPFTSSPSVSVPNRSGYRFAGYCPESGNTVDGGYVIGETAGLSNCFISKDGGVVAPSTYTTGGTLHAFWARECANVSHASCQLVMSYGNEQQSGRGSGQVAVTNNRDLTITYETSCDMGYHYISGEGTYNPVCVADENIIFLDSNGGTFAGTSSLTAVYGTKIMRPDDSAMTTSVNPITIPQRAFNIQYQPNGTDVTLAVTNSNTNATSTFNGYYKTATSTSSSDKYIGNTGYITSNGLAVGKQYTADATWYAKWSGGTVTLPSPTRPGYNFAGWYTESTGGDRIGGAGATYTPGASGTLYARWNAKTLEITLNDNGGSGGLVGDVNANCAKAGLRYGETWYNACGSQRGELHLYQIPSRSNYVFTGYYTDNGIKVVDADGNFLDSALTAYTENGQMYAQWTPVYTIQLGRNGGTGGASVLYEAYGIGFAMNTSGTYTAPFTIPSASLPTRTGYSFNGYWTSNGVQKISATGYVSNAKLFTENTALEARWNPKTFNITLNDNGGSGGLVGVTNQNCNYVGLKYDTEWYNACPVTGGGQSGEQGGRGNVALYQVPSRNGFVFNGYYTPDGSIQVIDQYGSLNQGALTAFSAAGTIYASWTEESASANIYTITLNANNGSTGTDRFNVYEKENIGWYSDASAEHVITASVFDSVANGGAGITQPTAPANKVFDGYWTTTSGGERITDNAGFIVHDPDFNSNKTFYAHWNNVASSTTVTLSPNGGTACATTSVTATYGSAMPTLDCAPSRTGYMFAGYFQNASSVSSGTKYYNADRSSAHNWDQIDSTATIYAQWTPQEYKVAYKCTSGGAVSVQENVSYNSEYTVLSLAGANCSVPQNKAFAGWQSSANNEIYQPDDTFTYLVDGNLTFTATYNDSFAITLSAPGVTNSPSPTTVYLKPGTNGGWYRDAALTQPISVMDTPPQKAGMIFNGYWSAQTNGVQIIDAWGNFEETSAALTAYNGTGTAYARWTTPAAQFTVTTTPISANTTFTFGISASGNFVVDWGDGSEPDVITKNNTNLQAISHTYTTASATGYQIGISGLATGYYSGGQTGLAAITFAQDQFLGLTNSTPLLVGSISGSLGAIFPTLGNTATQIPTFHATFYGCSNMTGAIPSNLFNGVTGSKKYMFAETFYHCTGLTGAIPGDLFSGVTGAAESMFFDTFMGCSGLTDAIPGNLFSGVTGAADYMFGQTFAGCTGLTGPIPGNLFSGVTGSADYMFDGTFEGCSGLTTIPAGLFGGVTGSADYMFEGTFGGCSGLTTIPAGLFGGVTGAAEGMFAGTFGWCTGLTGSLPTGLFNHITSAAAEMFQYTFRNTGFTGYIPPTMFSGLTNQSTIPDANNFMTDIFDMTSLDTTCPAGMIKYEPEPLASYWSPYVSCVEGPAYHIALNNNGGDTPGTTDIYEKYGTGWALSANPVSWANSVTITKPTKSGYVFGGYYDNLGNMIVNSNGAVIASNTQFDTYSSNSSNPDATLYAQWNQIAADFTITTTNLSAGGTFDFSMSAAGTFNVYCGDDGTLSSVNASTETVSGNTITRSVSSIYDSYRCTYSTGGQKTISFAGTATDYENSGGDLAAISFSENDGKIDSVSGSLSTIFPYKSSNSVSGAQPRFVGTFSGQTNLHSIPNTLFSGYTRGATHMFEGTFANSGLTSIPSGLFSSITTGADWMFDSTFSGCTGLIGSNVIPANLFGGITVGAEAMFASTFAYCSGLTDVPAGLFSNITTGARGLFGDTFAHSGLTSIPENLFAGIHSGAEYMFSGTFAGCSGLTTIPANLFSRITSAARGMFSATFRGCTNLSSVPGNLFAGITSTAGAAYLFNQTFLGCSSLHSVPDALFNRITGAPVTGMFDGTFAASGWVSGGNGSETGSCGLTVLPTGLFTGLNGAPASNMFHQTFAGCSNMVGELSPGMFGNIHGAQASGAFEMTFVGCSSLTGFVPPTLFETSELTPANPAIDDFMRGIFFGATSMDQSCPAGYTLHTTGFENYWGTITLGSSENPVVSCEEQNTYTVSLNDGDGNGGSDTVYWKPNIGYSLSQDGTFSFNQSVSVPSLTGYNFNGYWTQTGGNGVRVFNNSGNATNNQPDVPVSGMALTLYAAWTPKILTITLNDADATSNAVPQIVYLKYDDGFYANSGATGNPMSGIQIPQKTGFIFGGYYTGADGAGDPIINVSGEFIGSATTFTTQNATIYAKWTAQQFNINYVYNGGYEVQSPFVPVEYISANGNSYFDSGLNISRTYEIRSRFARSTNNASYLYGTQSSGTTSQLIYAYVGSNNLWRWGTSGYQSLSITKGILYSSIENYAGIKLNGVDYPLNYGNDFTTAQTLAIGASKNLSNAFMTGFKGNIYGFEVTNGTDVLFNGIPVCNSLTGTCGLLDVSNTSAPEFKVSEGSEPFSGGNVSLPASYTAGTATTITGQPVRAHSDFVGWCTNQNLTASSCSLSPTIAANSTGAKTFYAKWQCRTGYTDNGNNECIADTYTISFNGNGGNGGQAGIPLTTNYWTALPTINTTKPVKKGYTFMGWYDNADYTATGAVEYYNASGAAKYPAWDKAQNGTLYAGWKPNIVKVTLRNENNAEENWSPIYERYADGWYNDNAATPPAISEVTLPTRDGYTFRGYYAGKQADLTASGGSGLRWITNASTNNLPPANSFTSGSVGLYSAWAKNCPNLGNTGTCNLTVNNDGTVTYTTSCNAGYREINANTANVTCTQEYTLTYTCGDGATGTVPAPNPVEIAQGDTHTFKSGSACSKTGHTFAGWHVDIIPDSLYQPNATLTWNYEQDSDIVAQYTPNPYQITYSCGSGSWTGSAPETQSVNYGDANVLLQPTTICAKEGYYADGWDVSGTDPVDNYDGTLPQWLYEENKTFTAKWLPNIFTINLLHTDTGITRTGTPNPLYLKYDNGWYSSSSANLSSAIGQLTQTPLRTGYDFAGYYHNSTPIIDALGVIQENTNTFTTSNTSLTPHWNVKTYNISYDLYGGTNYANAPTSYTYGTAVTINGVPTRDNATFNGWCPVVNGVVQTNNCAMSQTISATDTGDKEFAAIWTCNPGYTDTNNVCAPNTVYVTLKKNGGSGVCAGASGTNDGIISCTYGQSCVLPVWNATTCNIANGKKVFVSWNSASNGNGTNYAPGADIQSALPTSGTMTVYAKWVDANCQAGTGVSSTSVNSVSNNAPVCNVSCSANYSQAGGATNVQSFTATGTSGVATYTPVCQLKTSYTITIDKNGGSGTLTVNGVTATGTDNVSLTCYHGNRVDLPGWSGEVNSANNITKNDSSFYGWLTNPSNPNTVAWFECTQSRTITARWDACTCGTGSNSTCATNGVSNNVCQYIHTCSDGYYHASNGSSVAYDSINCVQCSAGNYCPTNATTPTPCPTGYTSNAGASAQNQCFVTVTGGHYVGEIGQYDATWQTCAAGTYKGQHTVNYGGTSSCDTCTAGSYCPSGSTSPTLCPTNYTSNAGASAQNQCFVSCSAGKRVVTVNDKCTTPTGNWYSSAHTVNYGNTSVLGTDYNNCATNYTITSSTNALYHDAQSDCRRTISLNKNSGTVASGSSLASSQTCYEGVTCNLPDASVLVQSGYTFAGTWSTSSGANAPSCVSSVNTPTVGTYYACKSSGCNAVTLDNQTNGGTTADTVLYKKTGIADKWYDDNACTHEVTATPVPTKTHATFTGYYTSSTNTNTQVASPTTLGTFTANSSVTVYAHYDCDNGYQASGTDIAGACQMAMTVVEPTNHLVYNGTTTSNGTAQVCPGVTVTVPASGATVMYGTSAGSYTSPTPRTITNTGMVVVYYSVTADGYAPVTDHYYCYMEQATTNLNASNKVLTYNGTAQSCANVTPNRPTDATIGYALKTGNACPAPGASYVANAPTITNVSEGTKTICYSGSGANFSTYTSSYTCSMQKADGSVTLSSNSGSTDVGTSKQFTITNNLSGGALSVSPTSGASNVAIASIDGNTVTVTPQKTGTQTITVTSAATSNYNSATAQYTLTVGSGVMSADVNNVTKVYDGEALTCNGVTNVVPADATVKYRTAASGTYDLTDAPTVTNVSDSKTVYYQITKTNYTTIEGSFTCSITPADMTVYAATKKLAYDDGSAVSCAGGVTVSSPDGGTTITYSATQNGTYTATAPTLSDAGSSTVYYKVNSSTGNYNEFSGSYLCTMNKLVLSSASSELPYSGSTTFTASCYQGALSVTSNTSTVTATNNSGTITVTAPASAVNATLTVKCAATTNYLEITKTHTVVVDLGTITLNDATNGGTGGSGAIYNRRNDNVYKDAARQNIMTASAYPVDVPTKTNAVFTGYYSNSTSSGTTRYIENNGFINSAGIEYGKHYARNMTWYARFEDCTCDTSNEAVATCVASGVTNNQCVYNVTFNSGYSGAAVQTNPVAGVGAYTATGGVNSYSCNAGQYLPAGATSCATCLAGSYCPNSATYQYNPDSAQGLETCPTGYTSGGTGLSLQSQCAIAVPANKYIKTAGDSTPTNCSNGYSNVAENVTYGNTSSCDPNVITINYSVAHGGTQPQSHTCNYGSTFTLPAAVNDAIGYDFDKWESEGVIRPAGGSMKCTYQHLGVYSGSATITATWIPKNYTITYSCGTGATGTVSSQTVAYDSSHVLQSTAACSKGGYVADGWDVSGTNPTDHFGSGATMTWNYTSNKTFTVRWVNAAYTVALNGNGATTAGTGTLYTVYNTGVYLDSAHQNMMTDESNHITLPQKSYTVTYNPNYTGAASTTQTASSTFNGYYYSDTQYIDNSGYITSAGETAAIGYTNSSATWTANWTPASVTLPSLTRANYIFDGWWTAVSNGSKIGNAGASYTPTGNTTLYANWETCAYSAGAHSTAVFSTVNASNQCVYTVTCDTGYSQTGGTNTTTTFTATGAAGVATGKLNGCLTRKYNITYHAEGGVGVPADLPSDYDVINYVNMDGRGYIDTGIILDAGDEIRAKFGDGTGYVFGAQTMGRADLYGRFDPRGSFNYVFGARGLSTSRNETYSIVVNDTGVTENGVFRPFSQSASNNSMPNVNLAIGANYDGDHYTDNFTGKMYSFQIIDFRGNLLFNAIPVINLLNQTCALYDTVSEEVITDGITCPTVSGDSGGGQSIGRPDIKYVLPVQYRYATSTSIQGVPVRPNSTFVGWCTNLNDASTCAKPYVIGSNVVGDVDLYAKWECEPGYTDNGRNECEPNRLELVYSADHGTAPSPETCNYGSMLRLQPAITDATGYTFQNWLMIENNKVFGASQVIKCNSVNIGVTSNSARAQAVLTNLAYYCQPGTYLAAGATSCSTCTAGNYCPGGEFDYNANSNQGISACPTGYDDGGTGLAAQSECEISVDDDYYIATAGSSVQTACATGYNNVAENVAYGNTSECEPNEIVITFNNGGHGGDAPVTPSSCIYGETIILPDELSEDGYTFGDWAVSGTNNTFNAGDEIGCNATDLGISSGTVTINATWTANSYGISYQFNGGYDPRSLNGYTPVDYIQSDGDSYIDLGFPARIRRDWAEITFKWLENENHALFGNYQDGASSYNFILATGKTSGSSSETKPHARNASSAAVTLDMHLNLTDWYTLSLDQRNQFLRSYSPDVVQGFSLSGDSTTVTAHNMVLFGKRNNDGTVSSYSKIQLREFTLYESTDMSGADYSLKFHGIPVRRDSDGVCGLYDTVTGGFYTSNDVTNHPIICPATNSYPTTYTHGTATTVAAAPTRLHSRFGGWCTDEELTQCSDPGVISANATENQTLYAKWVCNAGFVKSGSECIAGKYIITLNAPDATTQGTPKLYTIYQAGTYLDSERTQLVSENTTGPNRLTVPVRRYTVTYDANDGAVTTTSANTTANYTFGGYYNQSLGTRYISDTGSITTIGIFYGRRYLGGTWYAKWTPKSVTLPTPTRPGYVFDGWWTAPTGGTQIVGTGTNSNQYTPTADITLYAHWTQCGHTAGANSTISEISASATQQCVYTVACNTGYSQLGGSDSTTSFNVTADVGVVTGTLPGCTLRTFTVDYSCGTDATGPAPTDDTVTYGTTPTLPSTTGSCAKTGYTFAGWRPNGETENWVNGTTWEYTSDKTFTAQWDINTYGITYDYNGGIVIPSENFVPVEYIQASSSGRYIDTMLTVSQDDEVRVKFSKDGTSAYYLFGATSNGNTASVTGYLSSGGGYWRWGSGLKSINATTGVHTAVLNASGLTYDGVFSSIGNTTQFTTPVTVAIGAGHAYSGTYGSSLVGKIYSFQILGADRSFRFNGVPVRQISTNKCGLYDTVTGMFRPSTSSSEFSCPTTSALPVNYTYGTGATVLGVPTRANATFNGWCPVVNGVVQTNDCAMTQTIASTDTGNKEFAASWTCDAGYTDTNNVCVPNTITFSYVTAHGTAPSSPASCTYNQLVQLPAAVDAPGYAFGGWSINSDTFDANETIRCNAANLGVNSGSVTVTALWTFDPKFTIVTTQMTANDTFQFYTTATGTFIVDWGDGTEPQVFVRNDTTSPSAYEHTFTEAGVYNIRVGGLATGYSTIANSNIVNPTIFFYNSGTYHGTPTKIASVSGSMGAVFPTLGSANGQIPRFARTFHGATNLTTVSSTLFDGVTGATTYMFSSLFKNCSSLTEIPSGLFAGVNGAAMSMFDNTFLGCSSLTSIPTGLFDGVNGAAAGMFNNTFAGCSGITAIPSGLFDGVTGAADSLFADTFYNCANLVTIPNGLFRGVSGSAQNMFLYTFGDCPKIQTLPAGLFSGVTSAAENIFAGTFMNDTGLTTIPNDLFQNVSGGAPGAFWATFYGCTGLTGPIPANLFQNITVAAENEFALTFSGATNLAGFVPPELFRGLNGATATDIMSEVFDDTALAEECPCGTYQFRTGYEDDWNGKVACAIGLKPNEHWYNNQCVADCRANASNGSSKTQKISKLKTSSGLEFPILSSRVTNPALNFGMENNQICYAPLEVGNGGSNSMNFKDALGTMYHIGSVSNNAPVGWDPQSSFFD